MIPEAPLPGDDGGKVAPETLELRARPQPVTRINRRVLIAVAAVVLMLLSALVLVALKPPSLPLAERPELFTVAPRPISEALAKLPASYDRIEPEPRRSEQSLPSGVPSLEPGKTDREDVGAAERAQRARLAGQAAGSPVLFRLQAKAAAGDAGLRPEATARPGAGSREAELAPNLSFDRGRALAEAGLGVTETSEPLRKLALLKAGADAAIVNPHVLARPLSPYQLLAGTVIAASLISGLNSDLPGIVIAQVTEPVYDSVSGRHLLIPQGSRLIGRYDNVVAFGQDRALVVWQRIIRPDGSSMVIDNLPATDTSGYAGLADAVDLHTGKLIEGAALATLLGVGSELAFGASDNDLVKALKQATQSTTNRAGQRLVERNLAVQPTLTVRPGWPLRVIVNKDIILDPYPQPAHP